MDNRAAQNKEDDIDRQLIADFLSGDAVALDQLVRRHYRRVFGFVARCTGGSAEVEDITQDVFIKIWRSLAKYDHTRPFRPWLYRIAKNCCLDYFKRRKNLTFTEMEGENEDSFAESVPDEELLPDVAFDVADLSASLQSAINDLPPIYRTILLLRLTEGLTLQEVSEVVGEPINTIKSRYNRALIKLRERLVKPKD